MSLSILHRATGLALAVGLLVLTAWLAGLALGADSYRRVVAVLSAGPVQVALALWVVAFVYHFANGIRHLCWDLGWGLEKAQARRSALVVILAAVLVAAYFVARLFLFGSAA